MQSNATRSKEYVAVEKEYVAVEKEIEKEYVAVEKEFEKEYVAVKKDSMHNASTQAQHLENPLYRCKSNMSQPTAFLRLCGLTISVILFLCGLQKGPRPMPRLQCGALRVDFAGTRADGTAVRSHPHHRRMLKGVAAG